MAAQLWFLRHGEAEPHGTRPDPDRRLTERGEAQARTAGAAIRALEIPIALVFTSPKVRARDTATLAAAAGGLPDPTDHDELLGLDRDAALLLAGLGDEAGHVLLVGHEPDFGTVVHELTGARSGPAGATASAGPRSPRARAGAAARSAPRAGQAAHRRGRPS